MYEITVQGIHPQGKRIHRGISLTGTTIGKDLVCLHLISEKFVLININQIVSIEINK